MFKGFQKPKRLVANTETLTERYGMFIAQPFERGFGSTIGTGLRRVLLSSIEGAAITAVRIDGVAHEFSPIPSVVEDATDIILNLKQVPFKMSGEGIRIACGDARQLVKKGDQPFGSFSTRSPMMLCCTSLVPPAIVSALDDSIRYAQMPLSNAKGALNSN